MKNYTQKKYIYNNDNEQSFLANERISGLKWLKYR